MAEEQKSQHWWLTVPGILTAIAGMITAVAGLVAALNQAGLFSLAPKQSPAIQADAKSPPSDSKRMEEAAASSSNASPSMITPGDQYPRQLASGAEVQVGRAKYKLLDVQLARRNIESLALTITIRMTNTSNYPDNFWNDYFRLLVDGVPRSPISNLNKIVYANSAEDGEVVFVFPETTKSIMLRIIHQQESTEIPIPFSPDSGTLVQRK